MSHLSVRSRIPIMPPGASRDAAVLLETRALRALGDVETAEGDLEAAMKSYREAARMQVSLGEKREIAAVNYGLGAVLTERGAVLLGAAQHPALSVPRDTHALIDALAANARARSRISGTTRSRAWSMRA